MARQYTVYFVDGPKAGETGTLDWDKMESPINTREEIEGTLYIYSRGDERAQLLARAYGAGSLF